MLVAATPAYVPVAAVRDGRVLAPRFGLIAVIAGPTAPARVDLGTVLVTCGVGALGMRVAEHLVRAYGVRRLVPAGRSAPDESARAAVAALEADGASVVAALDVADRTAVASLLGAHPPRGSVHAAGLHDDALLAHQTASGLLRVL